MRRLIYITTVIALLLSFTCGFGCDVKQTSSGEGAADDEQTLRFTAADVNGNTVSSEELFGSAKVTMINVWASWCGPCVGELNELQDLSKTLSEMGCMLIGILDDGEDASGLESGKKLINAHGLTYTMLIPNDEIHSQLSYMYYPTTFFVDSSGRMIGEPIIGAQVDKYLPAVQKLLADMDRTGA